MRPSLHSDPLCVGQKVTAMVYRLPKSSDVAGMLRAVQKTFNTRLSTTTEDPATQPDAETDSAPVPSPANPLDFSLPAVLQTPSARPRQVIIFSPGGSQGAAFAAQALKNADSGRYQVALQVRNPDRFGLYSQVRCGDLQMDIAQHPAARISTGPLAADPHDTLIIDPTVVTGLPDTLAVTPPGSSVAYSQNGVPLHEARKQALGLDSHTLISVVTTTRQPGAGTTVLPGGTLFADENDRFIDALHTIFRDRGFFKLVNVPDIQARQYEKIALNCALNVTATLFGQTMGELRATCQRDPRCDRLIGGLAAEVCAVAATQGIRIKPTDQVIADIHAVMARFPGHPTSMRTAFDAGDPTEIAVLNAGISGAGQRLRVATPLNDRVADTLALFEALRDTEPDPAGFHQRHAPMVKRALDELLDAAMRLA